MSASAEIVFDGSTGSGPLSGPDYVIPSEFGTRPGDGSNLFHSFLLFDLFTNGGIRESATFTGPDQIDNIFARVTGGRTSWIDGLLRSTIQSADFYFLNPAGVVMGPNAELDIQGSFYLSSADYVRLGANGRFDVSDPDSSILTADAPEAFGFLGPAAGAIQIFESQLQVSDGEAISVVGGPIYITGGPSGRIDAPGGRIDLVSVASAGEVGFDPTDRSSPLDTSSFAAMDDVTLDFYSYLDTSSGTGAGTVFIRGRDVLVEGGSYLLANSFGGSGSPIGIDIDSRRDLVIREGSILQSASDGFANASALLLHAGRNFEADQATLSTISVGFGAGGDLVIDAFGDGVLRSSIIDTSSSGFERSGDVVILAGRDLELSDTDIDTWSAGYGRSGDVAIVAGNDLALSDTDIDTHSEGAGRAGSVLLDGGNDTDLFFSSIDASTAGDFAGPGGDVAILAGGDLSFAVGEIRTWTENGFGDRAGDVRIEAGGEAFLSVANVETESFTTLGRGGDVVILADVLILDLASIVTESGSERSGNVSIVVGDYRQLNGSLIRTSTIIDGQAGNVTIDAARSAVIQGSDFAGPSVIDAAGRGQIAGFPSGTGGAIQVTTPDLRLDNAVLLAFSEGDGTAGTITLRGGKLSAENGSLLVSGTRGPGSAGGGSISIEMGESVRFSGGSGILNGTQSDGDAGPVTIEAPRVTLIGESLIANNTQSAGNAGLIRIDADHLRLQEGFGLSTVSSEDATGDAGPIEIVATGSVVLSGASTGPEARLAGILSSTSGEGDAGEISITSPVVRLEEGAVGAFSGGGTGDAADITFVVSQLIITNGGAVSGGSSGPGAGANITIDASESVLLSSDGGPATGIFNGVTGSGDAGRVSIQTPEMTISGPAIVESQTLGPGAGGVVEIDVDRLRIEGGGAISSATASVGLSGPIPNGPGGSVLVNARESVAIVGASGEGGPSAIVSASDSDGPAGSVRIATGQLELDQGLVTTKAFQSGAAGAIEVDADSIRMVNDALIDSSTATTGAGGDIHLSARMMEMSDSTVSVLSEGTADAGRIELDIDDTLELVNSSITAEALQAFGGSIVVSVGRMLRMTESTISSTVLGGAGDGGNVTIDPEFVILDDSRIIAQAEQGAGGNISITADVLIISPDSLISASSQLGIDGKVDLRTPDTNLAGSLATLPESFLDAASLMKNRCAARRSDDAGSFVVGGRGAIPASPDGFLPAPHPVAAGPLRSSGQGAYITSAADGSGLVYLVDCSG